MLMFNSEFLKEIKNTSKLFNVFKDFLKNQYLESMHLMIHRRHAVYRKEDLKLHKDHSLLF